jgi:hypothetical protein
LSIVKIHKSFAQKIVESANKSEIPAAAYVSGRLKKPPLPGGFNRGFPHASAILGVPTLGLTNLCEVLGDSSAILLGLGIADFVEVHHSF